ncbi:MAG TPA: type IX secretion system protein PorQ [Chitinophagaceae bacterium]|nr:type IX secretion system protein PorQ [Chitinophagaceae bacterium]
MFWRTFILVFFLTLETKAQTLGGDASFNFLKLPNTAQLTALGGVNITEPSADAGLAFNNPALLTKAMHTQMNAVFNAMYGDIKVYHLSGAFHSSKLNTTLGAGISYYNYGDVSSTDASGNILGKFRPRDWVIQLSAGRTYLKKWLYGATLKFANSGYGQYHSNAMAVDVGVLFKDSAKLFSASVLVKNMGFQLKKYAGGYEEDLPFDLQIGITKKLENAPFSFSITAQRMDQFDLVYNDTIFNNENGYSNERSNKITAEKIFRHLVFGTKIHIGDYVEVLAGYNFLRRKELNIGNAGNGLNGFSLGVGALFGKLQVRYARAYYQNNTAYNQLGLNMQLNKYFGLGKFGEKIGW